MATTFSQSMFKMLLVGAVLEVTRNSKDELFTLMGKEGKLGRSGETILTLKGETETIELGWRSNKPGATAIKVVSNPEPEKAKTAGTPRGAKVDAEIETLKARMSTLEGTVDALQKSMESMATELIALRAKVTKKAAPKAAKPTETAEPVVVNE